MAITAEIAKVFRFEAAHFLPNVPKTHQCHSMHGHSYIVTLRARGPIDRDRGWVMDLADMSQAFAPLLKTLDHALLNEIDGLENPTSENLAVFIMTRMAKIMPLLSSVSVEATDRIAITVTRDDVAMAM